MKFDYEYRTSDNQQHRGSITASSRDDAFASLKAQGIKPSRVVEAPGFFNKLLGKYKRWLAIVVLASLCFALIAFIMTRPEAAVLVGAAAAPELEDRAQLYGDPVVVSECEESLWTNVFKSAFDCRLAQYAIPGKMPQLVEPVASAFPEGNEQAVAFVEIADDDLAEVVQMKRMVNGIKQELADYLAAGGNIEGYLKRLDIRQRAERGIFETAQRQILKSKDHATWKEKNAELRAMGLPMVAVEATEE